MYYNNIVCLGSIAGIISVQYLFSLAIWHYMWLFSQSRRKALRKASRKASRESLRTALQRDRRYHDFVSIGRLIEQRAQCV